MHHEIATQKNKTLYFGNPMPKTNKKMKSGNRFYCDEFNADEIHKCTETKFERNWIFAVKSISSNLLYQIFATPHPVAYDPKFLMQKPRKKKSHIIYGPYMI